MNDLADIKQRIIEENRVQELLEKAGCECIKLKNNRYDAMLPSKFNSDNKSGINVYLNESLTCKLRTRAFLGKDIYDLISYIVFDCYEENEIKKCLPKSKRWICEQLGYEQGSSFPTESYDDPLKWLRDLRKQRNKKNIEIKESSILEESILNQYIMYPYYDYLNDGLNYETQMEFQIGLDLYSERVIFPIHNDYGEIINIKGRTIRSDYKAKEIPKFMYLYDASSIPYHLYNWHRALYYILEQKEVIIFEAEKTCWYATQWGYRNCVALGSGDITDFHVKKIRDLGFDISIVIGYDKDKTSKEIKTQARKFGYTHNIYTMWDGRNVFSAEKKHSPTDLGEEEFVNLYNDRIKYKLT